MDIKNQLAPEIINALKLISQKVDGHNVNWVVIASCGLALQGIDLQPKDIDILTDEDGILKISQILKDYELKPLKHSPSNIFDSTIYTLLINDRIVEVLSNFNIKARTDNKWHNLNGLLEFHDIIEIENVKIPVLPLLQAFEMYKLMKRKKDMLKALKIEHHLQKISQQKEGTTCQIPQK